MSFILDWYLSFVFNSSNISLCPTTYTWFLAPSISANVLLSGAALKPMLVSNKLIIQLEVVTCSYLNLSASAKYNKCLKFSAAVLETLSFAPLDIAIASLLLTTECVITDLPEKEDDHHHHPAPPMGGMPGMM